jgi:hypothetical protein
MRNNNFQNSQNLVNDIESLSEIRLAAERPCKYGFNQIRNRWYLNINGV